LGTCDPGASETRYVSTAGRLGKKTEDRKDEGLAFEIVDLHVAGRPAEALPQVRRARKPREVADLRAEPSREPVADRVAKDVEEAAVAVELVAEGMEGARIGRRQGAEKRRHFFA